MESSEEARAAIQAHEEKSERIRREIQEGLAIKTQEYREELVRQALRKHGEEPTPKLVQEILAYMEGHQMFS